jgi:hypothetical protein
LKILPGDLFVDIICFLVGSWNGFSGHMQNTSSLKCIVSSNNTDLASVLNFAENTRICVCQGALHLPWLAKWYVMFVNDVKYYSIHECTQKRITEIVWVDKMKYYNYRSFYFKVC